MELLQLRYFYDSAISESFAKTAEKHMVPASSVSASIKRLENELGSKLFERTANRIILNENGKKLKESLNVIFSELDQTITDITCPTDNTSINLLVRSLRASITNYIIEYRTKHTDINFKSVFSSSDEDFKNFDVIIDQQSDKYADYESFELKNFKICLRVSQNHPLCGKKLTLSQLKDQAFVTMGEHSHLHHIIVEACNRAGFTPNIIAQVNDTNCYAKLLRSEVAIGPGRENTTGNAGEGFAYLDVTDLDVKQTICVYYKKESARGNVKNFIEFLRTKATSKPQGHVI